MPRQTYPPIAHPSATSQAEAPTEPSHALHVGLARMLAGGVILDVTDHEQARLAEAAGAVAVMALERVPAEIRRAGGVARMASIERIRSIRKAVSIPVMAKCRIGHSSEARLLEELGVDFIDESEVLTPADPHLHIDKRDSRVPFVCGARNLGEALRRIAEGAAMIRTKGEAGTGDISQAVQHLRSIQGEIRSIATARPEELVGRARDLGSPLALVQSVASEGRLPVPNFAAGGIATPADAALVMSLGAEAVFVGSGVFLSAQPEATAAAIVKAVSCFDNPAGVLEAQAEAGAPMEGVEIAGLAAPERFEGRGS